MSLPVQHSIRIALLAALISAAYPAAPALAQSSGGGSISNDEKSLSGSRDSRPAESSKPSRRSSGSDEPRRASRKSSGGGGGGNPFDGAWMVYGRGVTCQGTSSNAIVVTSGQIIGQTARGTVSPSGQVNGHASGNGLTIITTGRLSGRSGGGTFRQSDGCTGTWTAAKQ